MSNIWELIKARKFEQACLEADLQFKETGDVAHIRHKVLALSHLQRHQEIISLSTQIINITNAEVDADFIRLGMAYWFMGNPSQAISTWKYATKTKYTDAAGGVGIHFLLFYAGVRTNNIKMQEQACVNLAKKIRDPLACNWPGPIAGFILGQINEQELLNAMSKKDILRDRHLCQASFYIALKRGINGDIAGERDWLEKAVSQIPSSWLEEEYYLAKYELEKICGVQAPVVPPEK